MTVYLNKIRFDHSKTLSQRDRSIVAIAATANGLWHRDGHTIAMLYTVAVHGPQYLIVCKLISILSLMTLSMSVKCKYFYVYTPMIRQRWNITDYQICSEYEGMTFVVPPLILPTAVTTAHICVAAGTL